MTTAVPDARDAERATALRLRAARDRLIDLLFRPLGLGETYPLQDVDLRGEHLMVTYGSPAAIPIDPGQLDVDYRPALDGSGIGDWMSGTGGKTTLVTPPVTDDVTFEIHARKRASGRQAVLRETAEVEVGLDAGLPARILDAQLLEPWLDPAPDDAPRIVDHGAAVTVAVDHSQDGVDYQLVLAPESGPVVPLSAEVTGPGERATIQLTTDRPMTEDVVLQVRARKRVGAGELEEALLNVRLQLAVRADPGLAAVLEAPVVDHGAAAAVLIADSQTSVRYRLYTRVLRDRDVIYGPDPAGVELLRVPVAGVGDVRVPAPPHAHPWRPPEGFTAAGPGAVGSGGPLPLPLPGLNGDRLVVVQAAKSHGATTGTVSSEVRLAAAALVLVRPDPAPPLVLEVDVDAGGLTGPVRAWGGQPGVFYYFRGDGEEVPPAYFHQRDDRDPRFDKGVGQLRIGVDFVPARDPDARDLALFDGAGAGAAARTPPPEVDLGARPFGTVLRARAVRARTRLDTELSHGAEVPAPPVIELERAEIAAGESARILVRASLPEERYRLFVDGRPLAPAQPGDGGDLAFDSEPLAVDTTFHLHVDRPADPGPAVVRRITLHVRVTAG